MSVEIKVPTVGESITEVTIGQWFKNDGDLVEMDEVICELESDKATFELTAEAAGVLHIRAEEGDTLEIGAVLCTIDTKVEKTDAVEDKPRDEPAPQDTKASSKKDKADVAEVRDMNVPTVGESITEVTLASW